MVTWRCADSTFYNEYRSLGLPSSKLFSTDIAKVETLLDEEWKLINFFWGLVEADGCVAAGDPLTDGSRNLSFIRISLTDFEILRILSDRFTAIMNRLGLQNADVLNVTRVRETHDQCLEMFALNVPRRLCLWLLEQLELIDNGLRLQKAQYARSLSAKIPYHRQSLLLQGIRWTTAMESLLAKFNDWSDEQEKQRWKLLLVPFMW